MLRAEKRQLELVLAVRSICCCCLLTPSSSPASQSVTSHPRAPAQQQKGEKKKRKKRKKGKFISGFLFSSCSLFQTWPMVKSTPLMPGCQAEQLSQQGNVHQSCREFLITLARSSSLSGSRRCHFIVSKIERRVWEEREALAAGKGEAEDPNSPGSWAGSSAWARGQSHSPGSREHLGTAAGTPGRFFLLQGAPGCVPSIPQASGDPHFSQSQSWARASPTNDSK